MRNILLILILFASMWVPMQTRAQVVLKTDLLEVSCTSTDTVLVPVRVLNFTDVGSFQFTLSWNPQNLDYIYTGALSPLFTSGPVNFGFDTVSNIAQGKMTFNWTKFGGGTVPDDTQVFALAFVRLGGPFSSVAFDNAPAVIEVTDVDGNEVAWSTINGGIQPFDDKAPVVACPANVTVSGAGATPVANIAPTTLTDNCGTPSAGFSATGATIVSAPNDADASGTAFNLGQTTVTYLATDVGGNTNSCSFTVTVEPAATDDFTLIAGNASGSCNQTLSIPITTLNFDSLGSLQFSLGWNPQILDYQTTDNFHPSLQLGPGNFGVTQIANGFLAFNWTTDQPLSGGTSLPDGAVLFTLEFTVLGASGSTTNIAFGDFPAVREAYYAEDLINEVPIVTIDGQSNIADTAPPTLTCPSNVATPADAGQTTASVTGLSPLFNDNCAGNVTLGYTATGATPGSGSGPANGLYNAGTTTVTYAATDASGNTATCTFTVTVDAGETLNLTLDSVTADCQGTGDTVSFNVYVENFVDVWGLQFSVNWDETVLNFISANNFYPGLGLDASSFLGFASTPGGLLRFLDGDGTNGWPDIPDGGILFTINFTVLNAAATTNLDFVPPFDAVNGSFNSIPLATTGGFFQSSDQSAPSITCPTVAPVVANAGLCSATVQIPAPTATDACSGISGITQTPSGNQFDVGATTVTFTATDNSANTASCTLTVTVTETTPPQFQNCPTQPITVPGTGPNCEGTATWPGVIAFDACGNVTLGPPNFQPGSSLPVGTTTIVYVATDDSGNTASCSFDVIVEDGEAPVLACPANVEVNATGGTGSCSGIAEFSDATATDNCDQSVDLTSDFGSGDEFPVGVTTVTFEGEDDAGNTDTCQFTVTVLDNAPPTIVCPASIIDTAAANACGANVDWTIPTPQDDCDQNAVVTLDPVVTPGSQFPVGITVLTYTASDASGNTSACSFSVTVQELIAPVLANCPTLTIIDLPPTDCDTMVTWTAPSASDNCGIDTVFSNIQPNTLFVAGTTTVTYTAIDFAGNSATCSFDVIVADKIPPVLGACPPNDTINVEGACDVVYPWTLPGVSDNCDPNPTVFSVPTPQDALPVGSTNTINVYAEDASGNRDTCQFVVTVIGTAVPGWMNVPDDIVVTVSQGCDTALTWQTPTAVGFCEDPVITVTPEPGSSFTTGVDTVVYTATDANGIQISTSFTVTVLENIAPSINCPQGVVANIGGVVESDPGEIVQDADTVATCDGVQLFFTTPIGLDNCSGVSVAPEGLTSGDVFPIGVNTISYVATDASGNTAACSFEIEVLGLSLTPEIDPLVSCAGADFDTLRVNAIDGASYFWTIPDGSTIGTDDVNELIIQVGNSNSGEYLVYAELNGCTSPEASIDVVLASAPMAVNDTFTLEVGMLDTLNVLANDAFFPGDAGISDYFPDNNSDLLLLQDGSFSYAMGEQSFTFTYLLCSKACPDLCSEAQVTIFAKTEGCEFIPNVFTPNGDGDHQFFVIPCLEGGTLRESSIVIYSQWGDKVYEASPYQNQWDGTLNGEAGKDLPDGTYFYIFKPRPNDPPQKGFVEIFR